MTSFLLGVHLVGESPSFGFFLSGNYSDLVETDDRTRRHHSGPYDANSFGKVSFASRLSSQILGRMAIGILCSCPFCFCTAAFNHLLYSFLSQPEISPHKLPVLHTRQSSPLHGFGRIHKRVRTKYGCSPGPDVIGIAAGICCNRPAVGTRLCRPARLQ